MRSFGGELIRHTKKPYRKALSMNSIPPRYLFDARQANRNVSVSGARYSTASAGRD